MNDWAMPHGGTPDWQITLVTAGLTSEAQDAVFDAMFTVLSRVLPENADVDLSAGPLPSASSAPLPSVAVGPSATGTNALAAAVPAMNSGSDHLYGWTTGNLRTHLGHDHGVLAGVGGHDDMFRQHFALHASHP